MTLKYREMSFRAARLANGSIASIFTVKTLAMYPRRLALPKRSFFLFGPRGTGKTTWLRDHLPDAKWFNLLLDREMLGLMREPARFRQELEALPPQSGGSRRSRHLTL